MTKKGSFSELLCLVTGYKNFLTQKELQTNMSSDMPNDLYFPEHKLAIEFDEHDHKDRDINYEIRRQKFLEDQLKCKYIRYNPNAKDFTIESVLSKIFQYIYQKHSS